jgi:hypothetical protein
MAPPPRPSCVSSVHDPDTRTRKILQPGAEPPSGPCTVSEAPPPSTSNIAARYTTNPTPLNGYVMRGSSALRAPSTLGISTSANMTSAYSTHNRAKPLTPPRTDNDPNSASEPPAPTRPRLLTRPSLPADSSSEPRRHSGYPLGLKRVPPPSAFSSVLDKAGPFSHNTARRPLSEYIPSVSVREKENTPATAAAPVVYSRISSPKRLQPLSRSQGVQDEHSARRSASDSSAGADSRSPRKVQNGSPAAPGMEKKGVSSFRSVLSAIPKARLLAGRVRAERA